MADILRSDWLTTGPSVDAFESAFAKSVDAKNAVAVSSGTAALHAAMYAIGIKPGDEVIVPAMTFAATANCVVYQGGKPVFADVEKDTLLIDVGAVEALISPRTKAVIAVDYAGQPCDYDALRVVVGRHGMALVDDACHALGAEYKGQKVGAVADATIFSLHPVKHITTGEGGVIATDDDGLAARMRMFRSHGITRDSRQRERDGDWFYAMEDLGFNYRLTDFQCALGLSQLAKLPKWLVRRREIAGQYDRAFSGLKGMSPLGVAPDVAHAYHLYVVAIDPEVIGVGRAQFFAALREAGIGVNVHYIPVHLHPYYQRNFGTARGLCPVAEEAYERIVTLPLYPSMGDDDVQRVIDAVKGTLARLTNA